MMFGWGGRRLVSWVVTGEATGWLEWWNELCNVLGSREDNVRSCWDNWSPPRFIGKNRMKFGVFRIKSLKI